MTDFIILWLQENALMAAAMAGVVALICRVTRCRPAIEHALWLLVLVKLLVPPVVSWPAAWREAMSDAVAFVSVTRAPVAPPDDLPDLSDGLPDLSDDFSYDLFALGDLFGDAPGASSIRADDPIAIVTMEATAQSGRVPEVYEESDLRDAFDLDGRSSDEMAMVGRADAVREMMNGSSRFMEHERESPKSDSTDDADAVESPSFDWGVLARIWLPRIWFGGASLFLLLNSIWILRFTRTLRSARPAPPELQGEVESLASRLGMRAPRTRVIPGAGSPLAWGLGRPTLLLPAGLVERLRREAWRGILLHELAHLRRRDHYVGCLLVAAQCIWWWNPVFWYVRRRLGESAELACDAWVVWETPNERRAYAESLLDVARTMSRSRGWGLPLPLTTFFSSRTGRSARQEFARRLTMILTESHRRTVSRLGMLTIALFAFLTVPAWSVGQGLGSSDEDATTIKETVTSDGRAVGVPVIEPVVESKIEVVDDGITVPVFQIDTARVVDVPISVIAVEGEPVVVQGVVVPVGEVPVVVAGRTQGLDGEGDDVRYRSDRRIERIERNIQKLERSLAAVLSELRSLRRDSSSTSGALGDSGGGTATTAGRRRSSTRSFGESEFGAAETVGRRRSTTRIVGDSESSTAETSGRRRSTASDLPGIGGRGFRGTAETAGRS